MLEKSLCVPWTPLTGPATFGKWLDAAKDHNIDVIVEPDLGNEDYLSTNGGYITPAAVENMIELAIQKGVTKFIVPKKVPTLLKGIVDATSLYAELLTRDDGYVTIKKLQLLILTGQMSSRRQCMVLE